MEIIDADDSIPCGRKAAEAALQIVADWEREAEVVAQMDAYSELTEWEPIPRITVTPVEGPTFAELRRILDKVQS
jgi:hypothetical protein